MRCLIAFILLSSPSAWAGAPPAEVIQLRSISIEARPERVVATYVFENHSKTSIERSFEFESPKTFREHVTVLPPKIEMRVRGKTVSTTPTQTPNNWRAVAEVHFAPRERLEVVHAYQAQPFESLERYREHFVRLLPRPIGAWEGPTKAQVHIEQPGAFEVIAWDPTFTLSSAEVRWRGRQRTTRIGVESSGQLPTRLQFVFAHDYWDTVDPQCESLCALHVAGQCPAMKGIEHADLSSFEEAVLVRCTDYARVVNGARPTSKTLRALLEARFVGQVGAYPPLVPRIVRQLDMSALSEHIEPMRRLGPIVDPTYSDARLSAEERAYVKRLEHEIRQRAKARTER